MKWVCRVGLHIAPSLQGEKEEEEEAKTFLSVAEGRDWRQCRTWLLCVSSSQPEIQVSRVCTHMLECRVK